MARVLRNVSSIVFLVVVLLTPVTLTAQTCAQVGFLAIGPNCNSQFGPGALCDICIQQDCFQWAAGDEDCFWDCMIGAIQWC
jgi:hypothetical protein